MTQPSGQDNGHDGREPIRVLVFSASRRSGSLNTRLATLAAKTIVAHGGMTDMAMMEEFDMPCYDQDDQDAQGFPPGAEEMRRRLEANDAFVIASPEYNASMPGLLKNAIDWVSRFKPQPFKERHALLLSASPSMTGGNRGLWALRVPLEHLGARVFPDMYSLAVANKAFAPDGRIADAQLWERFERTISSFLDLVEAAKHYPCAKKVWFEYLGEHVEPETERAE